jgi:hypothetical protein
LGWGLVALSLAGASVASAQPEPTPAAPAVSGPAYVHVEADPSVTLRRHGGRFGFLVCAAPCDTTIEVSSSESYYLAGLPYDAGLLLTPNHRNDVALEGDVGLHGLGLVSFTIGAASLGAGGFTFAFHAFIGALYDDGVPKENVIAYSSLLGGGAALLAIGLPLWLAFEPRAVVHEGEALQVALEPNGIAVRF